MKKIFITAKIRRLFAIVAGSLMMGSLLFSCAIKEPSQVEGTWIITDAVFPGVSALSKEDAIKWFGQSYQYGSDNVVLDQIECGKASYQKMHMSDDVFLQQYRVPLQKLGIADDEVAAYKVSCDTDVPLPGQLVLMSSEKEAFTVWDGVFFKMEKAETVKP
ncbi:hypothetical protein CA267_011565 [Alteromonas pelagimontana]|uniref:Uncharacterized protein n=1 Tax=Alteromonas pelagimontana TaxID=1858656 RepID=A0A6M4ME34_9ALTE|nr:hypothetical protein [Alteromonas pelagimontana]QJR81369.1 hypothetical protein CA267_011565 [Alteromonas pelagimontana]